MVKIVSGQWCRETFPQLPAADNFQEKYFFPEVFASYVVGIDWANDAARLGAEVAKLISTFNIVPLIFLAETEGAWLEQYEDRAEARNAFRYLKANHIDKQFDGGVIVDDSELPDFIQHLFTLTRLMASFPLVYFIDESQQFIGNLCHYGNLHISTLNKQFDQVFASAVDKSVFAYKEGGRC